MRCRQSLQKRCMLGIRRSKIQPGRPRIREVLGRYVAPVATQPDDQRAGGRVEGRNSAAFIGRDPKTPCVLNLSKPWETFTRAKFKIATLLVFTR